MSILDFFKKYSNHEIIYFRQLYYISPGLGRSISTLILTNKCVMVVYQAKELVFQMKVPHLVSNQFFAELLQT